MKINFSLRVLALLMAVLTFSMPFVTFAQQNLHAEAKRAAERDARNDVKPALWFLGGCIGSFVVLIVAYSSEPTPRATRLLGKSPEYVAVYTDTYIETAKKRQTYSVLTGCVASCITYIALVAVTSSID